MASPSPLPLKELSVENATSVFIEYLTYDAKNVQQMLAFVAKYPWVLQDSTVCTAIVTDPKCYNTLKQTGWWDTALAHVAEPDKLTLAWLAKHHVLALAYEASAKDLATHIDWPAWETLVQEHGPLHQVHDGDPDIFYRTRAFVALANRLGPDLAPLMCAAMHILLPMEHLEKTVGTAWSPLQKAQFSWLTEKMGVVADVWPTAQHIKTALKDAQKDVLAWQALVDSADLASLAVVYELNHGDLDDTIFELIQLAQSPPSRESLDYTMALEPSSGLTG